MSNVSRIVGFRPVRSLLGAEIGGRISKYCVLAASTTAVFKGDLVKLTGSSGLLQGGSLSGYPLPDAGVKEIVPCTPGDPAVGVVVGFSASPPNLDVGNTFRPTGAQTNDRIVWVADDPNWLFEIQANGSVTQTLVTKNANINTATPGSTTTGFSGMQLDTATLATTATLQLKVMELSQRVDNDITSTNVKVLIKINNHQLDTGTGTLGV